MYSLGLLAAGDGGEQADVQRSLVLARGADCARRPQTRSLLCATSFEALGVKSFERATTELREDLDAPALAGALKATEKKFQIAEQRVATPEASLTRQQNPGCMENL